MSAIEFVCEGCAWEGSDPVLDAHLFAWCPRCGRLAEFKELVARRRARGAQ